MINITNIDGVTFEIDGIKYYKNFISLVAGNSLRVVNVYSNAELVNFNNFANYQVNGNTFASAAAVQEALLPVLFTRSTLNGITIDGVIVDVSYTGNVLTFTLDNGSIVNITLDFVQTVTGTGVDNTDPLNPVINNSNAKTIAFALDLSAATLSNTLLEVVATAINNQAPFTVNQGEQMVFFFDEVKLSLVYRYYFRVKSGESTIASIDILNLIADGSTKIVLADYKIDLGTIGASTIEDAFNGDASEPFTIATERFIVSNQNGIDKVWYWNGGVGEFGNTGAQGAATAADFILLQSGVPDNSNLFIEQVGEDVAIGDILYLKSDGKFWKASNTSYALASGSLRIATEVILTDASGLVASNNIMALIPTTAIGVGAIAYMGAIGSIISEADRDLLPTGSFSRRVGVVYNATTLYFNPFDFIYEV
jgi:hypothetical protein